MKIYYAHSMHLYGKPQEKRDIELLVKMGFEVVNPSDQLFKDQLESIKAWCKEAGKDSEQTSEECMNFFESVVGSCEGLAFRAYPDGRIPSGVGKELTWAIKKEMPIIELPTLLNSKFMEVGETRQYLQYLGER